MKKSLVLLPLLLAACQQPVQHDTASGRPEVCIRKATPAQVSAELSSDLLNRGYSITQQTDNLVRADHPLKGFGAALLASAYNSNEMPNARVTYNIVKTESCTRVVADIAEVVNPGTGFEHTELLNNSQDSLLVQQTLDNLSATFGKKHNPKKSK